MELNQARFDTCVIHPVQSWAWGEFRKKQGSQIERFLVDGKGYLVIFRKLPIINKTIGVMTQSHSINNKVVKKLHALGKKHKAVFIKVEPYTHVAIDETEAVLQLRLNMQKLGLKKGKNLYPQYSFLVDLTHSEDDILANMKSKTRYNIRLAQRKGVQVKVESSDRAFDAYLKLLKETTDRQAFFAHTQAYQRNMWQEMKKAGIAKIVRANFEGNTLTAFVVFVFGDRIFYPYGASTRSYKNLMAPQLTMWEVMRYGKKMKSNELELWGSLGKNPNKHDSWYGFHRFKAGFGGKHIEYVGAYDLILEEFWYSIYHLTDRLRWWWLKNIKKS